MCIRDRSGCDIDREIYLAYVMDRAKQRIVIVASAEGGMSIEELAAEKPEAIKKVEIDPAVGLTGFQARELSFALDFPKEVLGKAVQLFMGCYKAMVDLDMNMLEINPLVLTKDQNLVALDAKMSFDDNALFRHPEINELNDNSQKDKREVAASEHDLSYVGLDGDIGCMINGAGLAMATMDMIKYCGGEPANFLDIGGGASPERVGKAFELVLADDNVKAMLVNVYAGINYNKSIDQIRNLTSFESVIATSNPFNSSFADENLSVYGRYQRSYGKIRGTLGTSLNFSKFNQFIRDTSAPSLNETFSQSYNSSIRTLFKNAPNIEAGIKYSISETNIGSLETKYFTESPFVELDALILKSFTFRTNYSTTKFKDQNTVLNNYKFFDASLSYRTDKESKWEFEIKATNLLDTKSQSQSSVSNISVSTSEYFIQPRFITLRLIYTL